MNEKTRLFGIRGKMLLSFLVLTLVAVLILGALVGLMYKEYSRSTSESYDGELASDNITQAELGLREADKALLMAINGKEVQLSTVSSNVTSAREKLVSCRDLSEFEQLDGCLVALDELDNQVRTVIESLSRKDAETAKKIYDTQLIEKADLLFDQLEVLRAEAVTDAEREYRHIDEVKKRLIFAFSVGSVVITAAAVAVAVVISGYFKMRLESIRGLAKRLSEYDISDDIKKMPNDEFGDTMAALNDSQFMIRDLVEKLHKDSSTISEIGVDISEATRTAAERLEKVNMAIFETSKIGNSVDSEANKILEDRDLAEDVVRRLRNLLRNSERAKEKLGESRAELSSISTYVSQIGITADYQNELAREYKGKVDKFKIVSADEEQKPES